MKKVIKLFILLIIHLNLLAGDPSISSNLSNQIVNSIQVDFRYNITNNTISKLENKVLPYRKVNDSTFLKAEDGVLYKSIDNGKTWLKISDLPEIFKIYPTWINISLDNTTIFVNITNGDKLYKSIDNGKTWEIILDMIYINKKYLGVENKIITIKNIRFYNSNIGIIFCSNNRINEDYYLYTIDGGKTWEKSNLTDCETKLHYIAGISYDINGDLYVISYTIQSNKYLVAKSIDNGKTFSFYKFVDLNNINNYQIIKGDIELKKCVLSNTNLEFYW